MVNAFLIKNMCFDCIIGSFQVSRHTLFNFSRSLRIGLLKIFHDLRILMSKRKKFRFFNENKYKIIYVKKNMPLHFIHYIQCCILIICSCCLINLENSFQWRQRERERLLKEILTLKAKSGFSKKICIFYTDIIFTFAAY